MPRLPAALMIAAAKTMENRQLSIIGTPVASTSLRSATCRRRWPGTNSPRLLPLAPKLLLLLLLLLLLPLPLLPVTFAPSAPPKKGELQPVAAKKDARLAVKEAPAQHTPLAAAPSNGARELP